MIISCSNQPENAGILKNYDFSMNDLVEKQIEEIKNDSLCKALLKDTNVIELVKIDANKIKKDLQELKNYDLNKPAFKNAFDVKNTGESTIFKSRDDDNIIKKLEVFKSADTITKVIIEIKNQNNLYESSKLIEWDINKCIRTRTIQKVKTMSSDTIDIISYLNGNCAITSSMLSTGK